MTTITIVVANFTNAINTNQFVVGEHLLEDDCVLLRWQ